MIDCNDDIILSKSIPVLYFIDGQSFSPYTYYSSTSTSQNRSYTELYQAIDWYEGFEAVLRPYSHNSSFTLTFDNTTGTCSTLYTAPSPVSENALDSLHPAAFSLYAYVSMSLKYSTQWQVPIGGIYAGHYHPVGYSTRRTINILYGSCEADLTGGLNCGSFAYTFTAAKKKCGLMLNPVNPVTTPTTPILDFDRVYSSIYPDTDYRDGYTPTQITKTMYKNNIDLPTISGNRLTYTYATSNPYIQSPNSSLYSYRKVNGATDAYSSVFAATSGPILVLPSTPTNDSPDFSVNRVLEYYYSDEPITKSELQGYSYSTILTNPKIKPFDLTVGAKVKALIEHTYFTVFPSTLNFSFTLAGQANFVGGYPQTYPRGLMNMLSITTNFSPPIFYRIPLTFNVRNRYVGKNAKFPAIY